MNQQTEAIIPHLGLLVLDVQASFLKVIPDAESFKKRIQFCVETARLFGIPTLFTEQRPDKLGHSLDNVRDLNPKARCTAKTRFSAFSESAFSQWQQEEEIQHILVVGLETPICVYQSVLEAINQEIDVTVLSDAVCCRRREDGEVAITAMRLHGAHVLPSETIFYSILSDSNHPSFKEFTQLVKKYSDK
ncbi:MAG: isochorismatase family protein [Verrucomicrobia bacterium]|nr:isochorismatase family protein [Verrucomicrobiota bacterium]MDA1065709.1 isochorismatase family protein [Verrucomicrobiota bacterium]